MLYRAIGWDSRKWISTVFVASMKAFPTVPMYKVLVILRGIYIWYQRYRCSVVDWSLRGTLGDHFVVFGPFGVVFGVYLKRECGQ